MNLTLEQAAPIRLDGRGIVVLGAHGGGIGTITSRILAAAGANLLCVDIDEARAREIADEVGGEACVADITSREEMEKLFARADQLFGESFHGVADIVGKSFPGPLDGFDDATIGRAIDMNLRHALYAVQIAAPMLARRGGGAMVFVSSLAGSKATPNQGIYSIAKGALEQLIRNAAFEFGPHGVRINGVAPGLTLTPGVQSKTTQAEAELIAQTIPLRKLATSADQANAIYFLLSELSGHVSGSIMHVDGGQMTSAGLPQLRPTGK